MTTIRWKNGGPLLLQPVPNYEYGLVAANQQCCCPPPPPPPPLRCFCLAWCSYFIEVLAPEDVSAKSPPLKCDNVPVSSLVLDNASFLYPDLVPGTPLIGGHQVGAFNGPSFFNADLSGYAYTVVRSDISGLACGNNPEITEEVVCYCLITCRTLDDGTQSYRVNLDGYVISTVVGVVGPDDCYASWRWAFASEHELTSSCVSAPKKWCGPAYDLLSILDTPLDITVTGTGSSLGSFNVVDDVYEESPENDSFPLAKSVGEAIRDAFSYTFRITSRQSCVSDSCNCGQSLTGVALSLYGEKFTVGNEPDPDRNSVSGEQVWSYTDSTSNPVIDYTVWDPDQLFLEEKYKVRAELFCSSEQQADGNVGPVDQDAWYVIVYSDCFEWDGGSVVSQTRNTYVGAYECYKHCEKFLPFGTPSLMYLVSSVTTPGLDSCSPLPSTSIVISFEDCE
jgi:hypothetical protein